MPRSLNDWVVDIRRRIRDTAASQNIMSRQEITDAIIDAQREARGQYWVNAVYDSLAYTPGRRDYPLPREVDRIRRVERQLTVYPPGSASDLFGWQELRDWQHRPGQQSNIITLRQDYPSVSPIRIHYEADLPVFPGEDTMATSIISTAVIIPLLNSALPFWRWPSPGFAQVLPGNEIFYYQSVGVTFFAGIQRGALGTGVQTATLPFGMRLDSATIITPVQVYDHADADRFIEARAIHLLLLQRLQNAGTDADRTVGTLAAEWSKMAAGIRQETQQRHEPRSIRMRRQTR